MRGHVLARLNQVGCSFQTCLDFISKNFHLDRAGPDRYEDEIETRRVQAIRSSESGDFSRVASASSEESSCLFPNTYVYGWHFL